MYTSEVDEDDIMAVDGQDGNQYVVLEVIQLQVSGIMMVQYGREDGVVVEHEGV